MTARVAYAYTITSTTVTKVDCNVVTNGTSVDNLCTVFVADVVSAPTGCTGQTILVFDQTTPAGKNALALVTSSLLLGLSVNVYVYRCNAIATGYPELGALDIYRP